MNSLLTVIQVYLPAICGIVPDDMVRAIRAFLDFCYIARRNIIDAHSLVELENALDRFRHYREVFVLAKVRPGGISLPRQHAIFHYPSHIRNFAALNGVCTSITESKHIVAVKRPYRRSNKHNALGQILLTNERIDKLAAARVDFGARGMLQGTVMEQALQRYEELCLYLFPPSFQNWLTNLFTDEAEEDSEMEVDEVPSFDADADENEREDNNDNDGAVDGPRTDGDVFFARHFRE